MASHIEGLFIQRNAFIEKCSKKQPCFLKNISKDNYPCVRCIVKLIDADQWLHNDHICTDSTCNGKNITQNESKNGLSRRTQHYGYEYNHKSANVFPLKKTKKIKTNLAIQVLAEILAPNFPDGKAPTQCIVNEYTQGQGIAPHTDNLCYGPIIATISLISSATMSMISKRKMDITLNSGDIVLLQDDARYCYKHTIGKMKQGNLNKEDPRRISVTFRTIAEQ